MRMPYVFAEVK